MATNKEIATAFLYGEEAKNSNGSFFVENINGVIIAFSYGKHFPIAIKFKDGVFFNGDGYSNTTARHKSLIRATLNDLSDDDLINTTDIKKIVDAIRYDGIRTKTEIIEQKI